ncbi:MAG TPA: class I SAM-dependent methyltransferase [Ilumatobacteraceae bacterium]|nr:class I SAM-dependent methyltransferase [Ilumatobacteraceae bacterium]
MHRAVKSSFKKLPLVRTLVAQRDAAAAELAALQQRHAELEAAQGFVPAGHFYSPMPSRTEVTRDAERLFGPAPRNLPGIDLAEDRQLELLTSFVEYYRELPFGPDRSDGLRYFYDNPAYSYSDAILLHCMIRHARPRRIVEIGSGYSSCMILDTNDQHFGGRIETTFIEPYPELLESLLTDDDRPHTRILPVRVQDVDLAEFTRLEADDILFVDSTHVGKVGSDVNQIVMEILPRLAPGVYVHVHDIFHPFEYPRSWIEEGRGWNEAYLLRAFLQFNDAFEVVLMNTFMQHFHEPFFASHMPLCLRNTGGSIWLRRRGTGPRPTAVHDDAGTL